MKTEKAETPYLFLLFLIPMLLLNYLTIIHPILVEFVLLSGPLPTSKFDIWLVTYIFNTFTYSDYLLLWLCSYFFGFIIGILVALFLSQPIFGNLLETREVIVGIMELATRIVYDFIIGFFVILFTFDWALSLITAYPYELTSHSVISYILSTGFLTGNITLKCVFLLSVYIKCKRNALVLESTYLAEEKVKRKLFRKIRWSLKERPSPTSNA